MEEVLLWREIVSRQRTIAAAALNVELPLNHSLEAYLDLMETLFSLKQPVKIRGEQKLILASINRPRENLVSGTIGRFSEIDLRLPWFDLEILDRANDRSTKEIHIPANLRPNFRAFYFEFSLATHKLAFEVNGRNGSLSPRQVLKFVQTLVQGEDIIRQFGHVNVSLIQDHEALDQIFALRTLRTLTIVYRLPNPDDQGTFDQQVEERMKSEHARRLTQRLDADATGSLTPNAETKMLAKSALSHGKVVAVGKDNSEVRVDFNSEDHPQVQKQRYYPDKIGDDTAFRRIASLFYHNRDE